MTPREARNAWLASLSVGSEVAVAEYNGAPESTWRRRTVVRVEEIRLEPLVFPDGHRLDPNIETALYLDDGSRFARSDGRCLCISENRRVYFGMNERLEPPHAP